jgi:hypothetical protein
MIEGSSALLTSRPREHWLYPPRTQPLYFTASRAFFFASWLSSSSLYEMSYLKMLRTYVVVSMPIFSAATISTLLNHLSPEAALHGFLAHA